MVWLYLEVYFSPVTAGLLGARTQQIPISMMPMRERDYPAVITALQLPSSNFLCSPFPIPPVKQEECLAVSQPTGDEAMLHFEDESCC